MKLKVFSVFDVKIGAYNVPFFCQSRGQAVRMFGDQASDPQSNLCKHAEDFTLFEIGEYNDETAKVESLDVPVPIGTALELKSRVGQA